MLFAVATFLVGLVAHFAIDRGIAPPLQRNAVAFFSLLIAVLALESRLLSEAGASLIQATTILTFIVSAYVIVLNYPTPIAVSDRLRRD